MVKCCQRMPQILGRMLANLSRKRIQMVIDVCRRRRAGPFAHHRSACLDDGPLLEFCHSLAQGVLGRLADYPSAMSWPWHLGSFPFAPTYRIAGATETIRTSDLQIRNLPLYPAELRGRARPFLAQCPLEVYPTCTG